MAKNRKKTEPSGLSAWLHQVVTQLADALRGPSGPPPGPGA